MSTNTETAASAAQIKQKFLRGFSLYAIADVLIRLRVFLLMPILTRTLGTVNYGILAQISVSTGVVSSFSGLGIGSAMRRYLPGLPVEQMRREYWMSMTCMMGSTALLSLPFFLFSGPLAAAFFGGSENAIYVVFGGIGLLVGVYHTNLMLYFRLVLQMKVYTSVMLVAEALSTVALVWAALAHGELFIIALAGLTVSVLLALLSTVLIGYYLGFAWPDFGPLRKYMTLGLPMMPLAFMSWALASADHLIIAYMLGVGSVGIYTVIYRLSFQSIYIVSTPIWTMVPGSVNALWNSGQRDEALALMRKTFLYNYLLAVPLACVLIFWGEFIVSKLATAEIATGAPLIVWVVLGYAFEHTSTYYRLIFTWFEKTRIFLVTFPLAMATNLLLNVLLIPVLGILGAALATTAAYGVLLCAEVLISRRYLKPRYPVGQALLTVAVGVGLAWPLSLLPHDTWPRFFAQTIGFGLLYLVCCWLLRLITREDIAAGLRLLRKDKADAT